MPHVRPQIRDRFRDVLTAALPPNYDIFSSRKFKYNHVVGRVLIDMRFLNDQTAEREVMGDSRTHVASLYIRIQRSSNEEELDDALDADEVAVVSAIEAHNFSDLLEEDPELLQVNFADEAEGGRALGAIVLRFDVEYRIEKSDPTNNID